MTSLNFLSQGLCTYQGATKPLSDCPGQVEI